MQVTKGSIITTIGSFKARNQYWIGDKLQIGLSKARNKKHYTCHQTKKGQQSKHRETEGEGIRRKTPCRGRLARVDLWVHQHGAK